MRTGYDSDNIEEIPADAQVVFFYSDGEPGTPTPAQLERFAGRVLIPITRKVGVVAKVVDVEVGCVWPPTEARHQIESGDSDTVYFEWGDLEAVTTALEGLNYNTWLAQWDGNAELPVIPGHNVVAKQYVSPPHSGGHYDKSVVSDEWPVAIAVPPSTKEDIMAEAPADTGQTGTAPPEVPADDETEAADQKTKLDAPIVDACFVSGGGYMVAADGGVFVSDAGVFHGSMAGNKLDADICAILVVDHTGYTLVAEDGGTFRFGNGPDVAAL